VSAGAFQASIMRALAHRIEFVTGASGARCQSRRESALAVGGPPGGGDLPLAVAQARQTMQRPTSCINASRKQPPSLRRAVCFWAPGGKHGTIARARFQQYASPQGR
jgi:hypothetical protein